MTEEKKIIIEGYQPETIKKGYQPSAPINIPTGDPKPQGGYQPISSGDNPSNRPTPPGDE